MNRFQRISAFTYAILALSLFAPAQASAKVQTKDIEYKDGKPTMAARIDKSAK